MNTEVANTDQATISSASPARPRTRPSSSHPLADRLRNLTDAYATVHYQLVCAAAELADSEVWALEGSPTPAHWLATVADVEECTSREWIRIGRLLRELPHIADAFEARRLSYSKVRTLTRVATADNEQELIELADGVPASQLTMVLARWMHNTWEPAAVEDYQHQHRSVRWRTEPDGMTTFTLRLPPHIAAILITLLTTMVMRSRPKRELGGTWPTVAQQHADAITELLTEGAGSVETEVVLHVRGDGCSTDDGTPIPETVIASLVPQAFVRALIHDIDGNPVDATNRRRHPTIRQKRVVKERDRVCVDCGRAELLEYDHEPDYDITHHTVTTELTLRCAPCHQRRHA